MLRVEPTDFEGAFRVSGPVELHLAILLYAPRRQWRYRGLSSSYY
jgi:predicted membrane GTPase involved in stress response